MSLARIRLDVIIHIIIMNYIETGKKAMWCFDKERYEEINDYLIDELNDRERRMVRQFRTSWMFHQT